MTKIAAIYARKSSADERRKGKDDQSASVDAQINNARLFAERNGWEVPAGLVFIDDAVSGGEFERRNGLNALLAKRHQFEVLVVADRSRLGRDMRRTAGLIEDLTDAGVEIWSFSDSIGLIARPGQSAEDMLVGAIYDYGSVRARKDASRRTREGLARVVETGYHAGGRCFGYRRGDPKSKNDRGEVVRDHVELEIQPVEAVVVRQIFECYAAGHGYTAIAKSLNGDPKYAELNRKFFEGDTPASPGHTFQPDRYPNPHSWCPTCIRAMLYRDRYRGVVVWGQKENYEKGGRVHLRRKQQAKDKIIEVEVPELAIISPGLWAKTRRRLKAVKENYARTDDGRMWLGRPETGGHSKYLLSGLMRCKCCGGSMVATTFKRSGQTVARYACSYNSKRGTTACTNSHRPSMAELNKLVLQEIRDSVLTPENIESVVKSASRKAAEWRRRKPQESERIEADIADLQAKIRCFIDLIGSGTAPDSVMQEIRKLEQRVKAKEQLLGELKVPDVVDLEQFRLHKQLKENLTRFRELLADKHVPKARQALRKLLGSGTLYFEPVEGGGYRLTGETRLGPLFEGCGEVCGAEERT